MVKIFKQQETSAMTYFRDTQAILMVVIFCLFPCLSSGQQPPSSNTILFVGGHVFKTETASFVPNRGILVANGRFQQLDVDPKSVSVSDIIKIANDEYIIPGIIDCHAHYNVRLLSKRREEFTVMPIIYLANGATVTFSCGEFDPEGMHKLRKRIESGDQIGPKLLNSGPYFGRARPGWRSGKPEQDIRDEVDFWANKGVGGFKAKSIDPDSLKVLVEQAHKHNLTVTGHLDSGFRNSVNPRDAITLGIDRIEHFIGGDAMPDSKSAYQSLQSIKSGTAEFKKITQHFIDHETTFDATLTAYGYLGIKPGEREEYGYWINERQFFTEYIQAKVKVRKPMRGMEIYQRIYDAKMKTIADFHRAGGTISLGTDHVSNGNHLPGFGIHREMDAMVRAGIPAEEVLKIATINGAKAFKIQDNHGSIDVGKSADLVVIKGNPIQAIRNTRNVQLVMASGKLYDPAKLLESVKGRLGPSSESEARDW
ncbi:MAG: amidohydrolase family protein [Mariniblastus sp.]|nr:amidohydrolase family protein [Mariniblastus sp.]